MLIRQILKDEKRFKEAAKLVFEKTDADNSGFVDLCELANMMNSMSIDFGIPAPTPKDVKEAFKSLDTDKNGKITLNEFTVLVRQIFELFNYE